MKLQTHIPLKSATKEIDYQSQLLLLGSCFVENMGDKLSYFKFQSQQNPFGILFHPLAIENLVERAVRKKTYSEKDIFFRNEQWHSYDAHSDLSDASPENLLQKLNTGLESTNRQIAKATHIIITLGTAWVYENIASNAVVANCHKVPQKEFRKNLLSVDSILKSLENTVNQIRYLNQEAKVLFTISPIRHLKDGFVENQRSKAHLITAVHELLDASYFESYELMMDELRDYRFYEKDMIHPNHVAIDYIWEKFKEVWVASKALSVMEKVEAIQKGLQHRPFDPQSDKHQQFLKSLEEKIMYLQKEYPFMDFSSEKRRG